MYCFNQLYFISLAFASFIPFFDSLLILTILLLCIDVIESVVTTHHVFCPLPPCIFYGRHHLDTFNIPSLFRGTNIIENPSTLNLIYELSWLFLTCVTIAADVVWIIEIRATP